MEPPEQRDRPFVQINVANRFFAFWMQELSRADMQQAPVKVDCRPFEFVSFAAP